MWREALIITFLGKKGALKKFFEKLDHLLLIHAYSLDTNVWMEPNSVTQTGKYLCVRVSCPISTGKDWISVEMNSFLLVDVNSYIQINVLLLGCFTVK